jgi:molybdate transport system substrate-binding protein
MLISLFKSREAIRVVGWAGLKTRKGGVMSPIISCLCGSLLLLALGWAPAQAEKIEPPWQKPPNQGFNFTVPGIDNVPDLHGEIVNPDLVIFFAGNQFMVVPDLLHAFRKAYPQYQRIYGETLPPGILAKQIEAGAVIIGNLRITAAPDIFTAGTGRIKELQETKGWFDQTVPYARNRLAIMVYKGNPDKIASLQDLGRPKVRVSMPNPAWEGIANTIIKAYAKAGGKQLVQRIMETKVKDGTTFLTHIHHRQTPIRIMRHESEAGPVWYTEAYFQEMIGNPIGLVEIPEKDNVVVIYEAARLKNAPHKQAAADFLKFLASQEGQAVYRKYGFLPVKAQGK